MKQIVFVKIKEREKEKRNGVVPFWVSKISLLFIFLGLGFFFFFFFLNIFLMLYNSHTVKGWLKKSESVQERK